MENQNLIKNMLTTLLGFGLFIGSFFLISPTAGAIAFLATVGVLLVIIGTNALRVPKEEEPSTTLPDNFSLEDLLAATGVSSVDDLPEGVIPLHTPKK
jgi:hypothetical protein